MAKKHRPLKDDEIVSLLRGNIKGSTKWADSTLQAERLAVQEYYDGEKPAPSHKGNSKYVSLDVFDTVENMKSTLLETFAGGYEIVWFEPQGEQDILPAKIATTYCDQVIFRDNDGYGVFRSAIDDGLKCRIGVAKVFWESIEEEEEEEFENVEFESLVMLLAQDPGIEFTEKEEHEDGTWSGKIKRKVNKSGVRILPIEPENFFIEGRAKKLAEAFITHRAKKTRSDLRKEGIDEDTIEAIGEGEDGWQDDIEELARFEGIGDDLKEREQFQDQTQTVWVYETYCDMDVEGTGKTKLWKITIAGDAILDKEQIKRRPFVLWSPIPKAHSIYGVNYADKVIPTQNAKTVLTRGILDHTVQTTNPRYTVLKGSLMNPRELMDNRVGGVVNVTRPEGVKPLEQAPLNPFVFQTVQLLDTDLEDTTGVSRLSQGLNKDVLSKQNSRGLVQDVVNAGQGRQKIIARNFANDFVRPLYLMVYELVLENEDRQRIIDVAGDWVEVDPKTWKPREHLKIEFKLGHGEMDAEAEKWLMTDQVLSSNPTTLPLYGLQQKHTVLSKFLSAKGVKDINNHLKPWQQAQQEQAQAGPPPEFQLEMKKLEIEAKRTEIEHMKVQMAHAQAMQKLQLDAEKAKADFAIKSDKQDLDERAQQHQEFVDKAELEIAKTAEDVRAIASPSG
jgi:hypothetical protein